MKRKTLEKWNLWSANSSALGHLPSLWVHDAEDVSFKSEQNIPLNEDILTAFTNSSDAGRWYGTWINVDVATRKVKSWFTTGSESKIMVTESEFDGFEYSEKPAWKCEPSSVVWGEADG